MSKPVKIGIWGGNCGHAHDVQETPKRLTSVTIRSGHCIDAISFTYEGCDGDDYEEGPWGGRGGKLDKIDLESSMDYVKQISGTIGKYQGYYVVTSLKIVTSRGINKTYGTNNGSTSFNIPVLDGAIVGFFGRSGQFLDAIGVYVFNP